jgi:[ribosomal protein S18]-alanine N-acetyltransferase
VNFRLRTFAPSDFDTLYEIDQACYEPRIAYSRPEMRRYLRFPGADCIVAESSDSGATATVGFCITAHRASWGYIITMDVLASHRRLGVGSLLLSEAERRLIAAGVSTVGLETATDNAAAVAFWHKHGYRSRGVQKNYYPGGRDAFTMTKSLVQSGKSSPAHAG